MIIKQEVEKALSGKQIGKSTNLEKEIEKILDKKQSNQNIDLEKEIEKIIDKKLSNKNNNLEKEIEKILDKKKSNQVIDLEKEINRILDKRKAEEEKKRQENSKKDIARQLLDEVEWSLKNARTSLKEDKERLKKYKEDKENIRRFKEKLKRIEDGTEEFEKYNKEEIDKANKKIEEVNKDILLVDYRFKEGAFAFFEWVGEKYPEYQQDAVKALEMLNEYYKKGDVKKTDGDATSYKNLLASADFYKQFNEFQSKNRGVHTSTNFSILAKAMVSCNKNVYSSDKNRFNNVEYLYTGNNNPIEQWYFNEKVVYDELVRIIKDKYLNENDDVAMEKAKEDYRKKHLKEPVIDRYESLLKVSFQLVAIAKNSSEELLDKYTFCLNGESLKKFDTIIQDYTFNEIIMNYKKITNKQVLLEEKTNAQETIKQLQLNKAHREKMIQRLKDMEDDETARLKEEIKETEKEVARLEKEYQEKKEAYDKLK